MSESGARTTTHLAIVDGMIEPEFTGLKQRAESLRRMAESVHEVLAPTYRRRASELELQLWLSQLRAGLEVGPIAA